MEKIIEILASELGKSAQHITNVISLLDEGSTVPFIARYRKEMHGGMDDTVLRELADRLKYLRNLQARREEITAAIATQDKLTEELEAAIENAATLAELEDIYRPFKQKRRTRAGIAKEKGLEPLALEIFAQARDAIPLEALAEAYISEEKGVPDIDAALKGASDIIAEMISDDADIRKKLRAAIAREGVLTSKAATEEDSVYRIYYDFTSRISRLQGYQILAINRGERENFLKVTAGMERDSALPIVRRAVVIPGSAYMEFIKAAAEDAYDRLIEPSVEREIRSTLTESAAEGAIKMFGLNLRPLLMQPPIKGKVTLGFDPGYRTGCKIAVVDATGKTLDTAVVYPTPPKSDIEGSKKILKRLIDKHNIELIAIGNGTASAESEVFVAEMLREIPQKVAYAMVNEAGASVYSASKLAAEEFPDYDVSLRSAISIARRLQDPLAELVKIDPKSIGVGQYQHDMPQSQLDETLGGVVESCVNSVGVDLNTASPALLSYVSGLNGTTAKNIVKFREENGAFGSRKKLLKVPKLGPKAFEQCAGFLRIPESENLLDNTAVHPESYSAAEKLLNLCGYDVQDAKSGNLTELPNRIKEIGAEKAAEFCGVGVPTLNDISAELIKPGRDVRDELPQPELRTDVMSIKDLRDGMIISGVVRNVIDFGVFVDIGVHQDGLVHISQICNEFIKHPSEKLAVGDNVKVKILDVDEDKNRISLSIRDA